MKSYFRWKLKEAPRNTNTNTNTATQLAIQGNDYWTVEQSRHTKKRAFISPIDSLYSSNVEMCKWIHVQQFSGRTVWILYLLVRFTQSFVFCLFDCCCCCSLMQTFAVYCVCRNFIFRLCVCFFVCSFCCCFLFICFAFSDNWLMPNTLSSANV